MVDAPFIRLATRVEWNSIVHDDRPITWDDADNQAGFRLDRRKAWCFIDGDLCELVSGTVACSGCVSDYEGVGAGCHECGHTGKRRVSTWVPYVAQPKGEA